MLNLVAKIASWAHNMTMKKSAFTMNQGRPTYEYELESYFLYLSYNCRLRHQAYTGIVASGNSSAVLHYIANDKVISPTSLVLADMGPELMGYASDVTRTYPANGQFSDLQRTLYEMVLNTQTTLVSMLAPGVYWRNISAKASECVCTELLKAGLVVGNVSDLLANGIARIFLPHGVGHFLGLDVHDTDPIYQLASGMVLTVEPGIYFNNALLTPALANASQAQYLVAAEIAKYMPLGGVRIEDDYVITGSGFLSLSDSPKTVSGIEALMNSGF